MAIYDRPVRLLLREMVAELAPEEGKVFTRQQALAWFAERYPRVKDGTVTAHLLRFSTNANSRVHYSPRPDEDLLFQIDGSRFRLYEAAKDPPPLRDRAVGDAPPGDPGDEGPAAPSEFAYERDLRDFLAKHPSVIERGLRLYEEEGIKGVEFPVGGRFVDILGVDTQNRLVVIELKVSRGYDRVVGQLLRYMAWVRKHEAEPDQGVRGIIIAREISEDLRLACSGISDIELFEYELSVVLRNVEPDREQ